VAGEDRGDKTPAKAEKAVPFRLPNDQAGRLLGQVLPPDAKPGSLNNPAPQAPSAFPSPRLDEPRLGMPGTQAIMSRLPAPVRKKEARPRLVVEEGLGEALGDPVAPQRPAFAVSRRTRIASEDVAIPPPLPVIAQPLPDRVPLDDATAEASTAAVLTAEMPPRTSPIPFVRARVPEPFANRRPLTTRIPDEEPTPVVDAPGGIK
jgi:hypothetical protein